MYMHMPSVHGRLSGAVRRADRFCLARHKFDDVLRNFTRGNGSAGAHAPAPAPAPTHAHAHAPAHAHAHAPAISTLRLLITAVAPAPPRLATPPRCLATQPRRPAFPPRFARLLSCCRLRSASSLLSAQWSAPPTTTATLATTLLAITPSRPDPAPALHGVSPRPTPCPRSHP